MAKIKIIAGDCPEGDYLIYWELVDRKMLGQTIEGAPKFNKERIWFLRHFKNFTIFDNKIAFVSEVEKIPEDQRVYLTPQYVSSIEVVTEENKKTLLGTAGWGTAGALALGPLGAIGGMLFGGSNKQVTFVCNLEDGHKFMAQSTSDIVNKLTAAMFDKKPEKLEQTQEAVGNDTKECPFCAETIKEAAVFCRFCQKDLE